MTGTQTTERSTDAMLAALAALLVEDAAEAQTKTLNVNVETKNGNERN